jgi:hypothetical protein
VSMEAEATKLHFLTLAEPEKAQAVRRLAYQGYSDHGIAQATGLSVEMVRRVLSEHEAHGEAGLSARSANDEDRSLSFLSINRNKREGGCSR